MKPLMTRKLVRDAWKMRTRIVLLVIVVMAGTGLSATLQQSYQNLRSSYDTMYEENSLAHVFITLDQPRPALDSPAADFGGLGMQDLSDGVARLSIEGTIEVDGEDQKALLVGMPLHQWPAVNDVCVLDGPLDVPADEQVYACDPGAKARAGIHPLGTRDAAFLHARFAEVHGVRDRAPLTVTVGNREYDFRTQGFALNSEFLIATANPELLVPEIGSLAVIWTTQEYLEDVARDLGFGDPDDPEGPLANEYFLRVTSGSEEDKARAAVRHHQDNPQRYADLHLRTMLVREDTLAYALAEGDVEGFREMTPIITAIVLIVAFATVSVTMERLVAHQRPTIGILRALGAGRTAIIGHYLAFTLVVGVAGGILGVLLGAWGSRVMSEWYRSFIGFPVLKLGFHVGDALVLGGVAAGSAVLGGLRAAVHAANVPIASAMQVQGHGTPSGWMRRVTARLGLVGRLATRNITRNRGRAAFTVGGVALSTVLTFSMVGLFDSIIILVDEQFAERENWDGQLNVAPPQQEADLEDALRGVGWVQEVEPFLVAAGRLEGMDDPVRLVGQQRDSMHALKAVAGESDFGRGESMLVGQVVLGLYEEDTGETLEVGDTVLLYVDDQPHRVRLDGILEELLGFNVYLPLDVVQDYVGAPVATGAYMTVAGGRTAEADDLKDVPGYISFTEKDRLANLLEVSFDSFVQFAGVFAVVGALLSVVVVLNTSAVNLQERTMDHGTLKALGLQDRTLVAVLAVENLVLGVLAAALGAVLGAAATVALLYTFTAELNMTLPYNMPASHVIAIMLVVVALTQLTTLLAARHLKKLDLADIIKRRGV